MRVAELQSIIEDIRRVCLAVGDKKSAESLSDLESALRTRRSEDLEQFLQQLSSDLKAADAPAVERYRLRLAATGLDEQKFHALWSDIASDRTLKKADLYRLIESIGGRIDKKASTDRLLDDLKRAFYAQLYDKDAQAMANRATPW